MKIAVVANTGWYIYNFRRNLMRALEDAGHHVIAISSVDDHSRKLIGEGFRHRSIPLDGGGTHPVREVHSIVALRGVLRREKIDLVLSYTPKGNIYAGLAATGRPVAQIANISGLGRAFVENTPLTRLVRALYRFALKRTVRVFFQNDDDMAAFLAAGMVDPDRIGRVPGSGVDLERFRSSEDVGACTRDDRQAVFLFVARMLWAKGLGELIEAARRVRASHPQAHIRLLGKMEAGAGAIPVEQMKAWVDEGIVDYLGTTDDVRSCIAAADCVVLPSWYREGVPRSLLEAAAMARPVITTDSIGCRDTVDDGVSGFLCRARDSGDLAAQMERFLSLLPEERRAMGAAGRRKMEREFDEKIVISRYLEAIAEFSTQTTGSTVAR